jgi:hypothetical protein
MWSVKSKTARTESGVGTALAPISATLSIKVAASSDPAFELHEPN